MTNAERIKKITQCARQLCCAKVAFLHPSKMQVLKMPQLIQNEFDKKVKIFKIF